MADKVITSTGDCSACCEPPADCSCALLIPPLDVPYADYATAATAIADQTDNCIGYYSVGESLGGLTATFDGTTLGLTGIDGGGGLGSSVAMFASVSLLAGQVLSGAFTSGGTLTALALFKCGESSPVDSDSDSGASGTLTVTAPDDGEYFIAINSSAFDSGSLTVAFSITCSGVFWVNPVIALWDDSGTTRQLEACPKMLLPPLTEAGWGWWADCANAALAISGQSADCLVYNEYPYISMSAVDSGTGVNLDAVMEMFNPPIMWVSLNLEAGETLTAAYTASVGAVSVTIFDYEGNEVETLLGVSPLTSAALPYTGRYIVRATGAGDFPVGTTVSVDYTSSGAISANQIQSLYNIDLDCPARLNCGDSCP